MPLAGLSLVLSGCATLPSSGPTARQIVKRADGAGNGLRFAIRPLDAAAVAALDKPTIDRDVGLASLAVDNGPPRVGPGDVLSITLYEIGVSLFAGPARDAGGTYDPSAHSERFPAVPVDAGGRIELPYIGRIDAAGLTTSEIGAAIEQSLIAKSQRPQALVTIATNASNAAFVGGDVRRPARLDIGVPRDRLLDAVTLAGGAAFPVDDVVLRLTRGGRTVEQRLGAIGAGGADDLVLLPGDRIELVRRPRSFTVFGATSRVSQVAFEAGQVSLAEAIARVGGPSDGAADPTAIFLFRYDDAVSEGGGSPVVYRLDMLDPASYFLAQRFRMRDKDVIYIANAAANQPTKLVGIINQLFSPFITVRQATR